MRSSSWAWDRCKVLQALGILPRVVPASTLQQAATEIRRRPANGRGGENRECTLECGRAMTASQGVPAFGYLVSKQDMGLHISRMKGYKLHPWKQLLFHPGLLVSTTRVCMCVMAVNPSLTQSSC